MSKGNLFFPNKLIIDTERKELTFFKRNITGIGYFKSTMKFRDVVSISIHHRNEILLYSTILIESKGGLIIQANGFNPQDVEEIKNLIENM